MDPRLASQNRLDAVVISSAIASWRSWRGDILDGVEEAHQVAAAAGLGETIVGQLTFAYTLLLSSQFQGFCRDLHLAVADAYFLYVAEHSIAAANVLRSRLVEGRKLDQGNPSPANIGSDFGRFAVRFWDRIVSLHPHAEHAKQRLDMLCLWRNSIAHSDFSDPRLGANRLQPGAKPTLTLDEARDFRRACDELATVFDSFAHDLLVVLVEGPPRP